jgi:hypothetical protein
MSDCSMSEGAVSAPMKYRVRIMNGCDVYDEWDVENRYQALDSARAMLRQSEVENLRDPFALINTLSTDPAYVGEIHWPTTQSITLGPDGEEIR